MKLFYFLFQNVYVCKKVTVVHFFDVLLHAYFANEIKLVSLMLFFALTDPLICRSIHIVFLYNTKTASFFDDEVFRRIRQFHNGDLELHKHLGRPGLFRVMAAVFVRGGGDMMTL